MTKLEALRTLAVKVEAGEWVSRRTTTKAAGFDDESIIDAVRAYHGSLDAAQDLHEALLPGWHFDIDSEAGGVCVFKSALDSAELGKCECLARAWLLAILKALIADGRSDALQDLADADRDLI